MRAEPFANARGAFTRAPFVAAQLFRQPFVERAFVGQLFRRAFAGGSFCAAFPRAFARGTFCAVAFARTFGRRAGSTFAGGNVSFAGSIELLQVGKLRNFSATFRRLLRQVNAFATVLLAQPPTRFYGTFMDFYKWLLNINGAFI